MPWIIGKLPTGVEIIDKAMFRGALVLATNAGVYVYDGKNQLQKLEPVSFDLSPDHGRLRIESLDGFEPNRN